MPAPNEHATAASERATVAQFLHERAAVTPGEVALAVAGGPTLSYRSWDARSNAAAGGLAETGVGPGDRVALLFGGQVWTDLAVGYLAAFKVGATAVPVSPSLNGQDLARVLRHCQPAAVITASDHTAVTEPYEPTTVARLEADRGSEPFPPLMPDGGEADAAEMLYPSGVLRLPQPDTRSHDELTDDAAWPPEVGAGLLLHAWAPGTPAGQAALRWPLRPNGAGGPAMLAPGLDPEQFCALVAEHRPVAAGIGAALARMLPAHCGSHWRHDLSSLTTVLVDAAPDTKMLNGLAATVPSATVRLFPAAATHRDPPFPTGVAVAPMAPSQEGMVWHEQFAPGSFNLSPLARRYRGPLDLTALERALDELVRRHSSLRTTFSIAGGKPVQLVWPHRSVPLRLLDLSRLPVREAESEIHRLISDGRSRPVDLVGGPLFEPWVVRLGDEDHVMVIRVHHSVFDDWSVGPFRTELSVLYSAFVSGAPSPLPDLAVQFDEISRRQRLELDGCTGRAERSFWQEELSGAPLSVELPIGDPDRPPGSRLGPSAPVRFEVGAEVTKALRALAARERATLFMVTLAAFGVLVQRYTGQDDLVLSTLVANRSRAETEGMIGCFAKKVLVRLRLTGDPTFPELVLRARQALLGAMAHQELAFETVLQETLGPAAAVHGLAPQISVKFQATVAPSGRLRLPGVSAGPVPCGPADPGAHFLAARPGTAGGPDAAPWGMGLYRGTFLGLSVSEEDDRLGLVAEGVFHPPAVERLLRHFATLLSDIVAAPDRRIAALRMLDDEPSGDGSAPDVRGAVAPTVDLRGFRIEPARIQAALSDYPGLAQVAVVIRHDRPSDPRLVAYVVVAAGAAAPTLAQLRRHLWSKLPGYAWPAAMVVLEAGPDGGLDGDRLPPPPAPGPGGDSRGDDGGGRPEERMLAALWADATGSEMVDADGNYWQSFSFLEALAAARQNGVGVDFPSVIRNRTLGTLAADLSAG